MIGTIFSAFGFLRKLRNMPWQVWLGAALVAAVVGAYWMHKRAVSEAVDAAVTGLVEASELAAKDAVIKELARRKVATDMANDELKKQIAVAQVEALMAAKELEDYEANTTVNPDGIVDAALLGRLRAN